MKHKGKILTTSAAFILFVSLSPASGQTPEQQAASPETQQQRKALEDPIRQLNLSAEQTEKIRLIREQNKAERLAINERVREANRVLEDALDADNPNESVVEQRVHELAEAQAASMRMRFLTEVRIRRVLTPAQLTTLRTLRQQSNQLARERLRAERQQQRQQGMDQSPLQTPRNRIGPLLRQRRLQERSRP